MTKATKLHICLNGKMLNATEKLFTVQNRAFRYGDGLFESICVANGKIPLLKEHFERIKAGATVLKYVWPEKLTEKTFLKNVADLLKLNGLKDARLRFSLFRTEGGLYLPLNNNSEYLIESFALSKTPFEFNNDGFLIDIYSETEKHFNSLSPYKTANGLLYVLAAVHKNTNGFDDCLILNSRSRIIESIDSNLFIVKDNEVYTPPLQEGCIAGVTRAYLIKHTLPALKIQLHESPLTLAELFEADEVFLTNAIYGVRWVKQYKSKTYTNKLSQKISKALREELLTQN